MDGITVGRTTGRSGGRQARKPQRASKLPLMILAALGLALLIGAVAAFKPWELFTPQLPVPSWIKIDDGFSKPERNVIIQAATDWDDRFKCGRTVVFHRWEAQTNLRPGQTLVEQAGRGEIWVDPDYDVGGYNARNAILHAMTHACGGDPSTPAAYQGLVLDEVEGVTLDAFTGLTVVYRNNQSQYDDVGDIEEGLAEYMAMQIPGYPGSNHSAYIYWKSTLMSLGLTPDQVWAYHRNSDLPGFVMKVLGREGQQMSAQDLKDVLAAFYVPDSPNAP